MLLTRRRSRAWQSRQTVPIPAVIRALLVAAALVAFTLWVHLLGFNAPYTWDSALQLTIGNLAWRFDDLRLYADLWDVKPPGIYWYQTLLYALLPPVAASLHVMDFALYVAGAFAFYRLCRIESGRLLALLAACVWLYFGHHPDFVNVAGFYSEEYAAIFAIFAVAVAHRYRRRGASWLPVASGALAATAILFKHPGAACALPALILMAERRPLRATALFAGSAAVVLLAVAAMYAWQGTFDAFLDCQIGFLIEQRWSQPNDRMLGPLLDLPERVTTRFAPYSWLVAAGLFGAAVCLMRPTRYRLAVLTWLLADVALIVMQRFYFEHTWVMAFPSLTLAALGGATWVLQPGHGEARAVRVARLAAAAALVALVAVPLTRVYAQRAPIVAASWRVLLGGPPAWKQRPGSSFEEAIGRYVREQTAPDDTFFVWTTGTGVAAYWSAERRPASRYIYSFSARPAEQRAELARRWPAFIMITGNPKAEHHFSPWLAEHYVHDLEILGDYRVWLWRRRPD